VSGFDFDIFASHYQHMYGEPDYIPNADFTRDGLINYLDLFPLMPWFGKPLGPPADCPGVAPWAILLADNFRAMNEAPVKWLRWWGSFFNWDQNEPPAILPQSWQIGFWSEAPEPNSRRPRTLLKKIDIPAGRVGCVRAGRSPKLHFSEDNFSYTVFEYVVDLNATEVFQPADFPSPDGTYWVSIMAVYAPEANSIYPWGWLSRPWSLVGPSVCITLNSEPQEQTVIDQNQTVGIRNQIQFGESGPISGIWGLAFELGTDPNRIKWEQGYTSIRDWSSYKGVVSCATADSQGQIDPCTILPADDWLCNGTNPVTGIVWWGSYLGYIFDYNDWELNLYDEPSHFLLSIWTDVPAEDPCGFSHPGHKIWEYKAIAYDEAMVGYCRPQDTNLDPCEPVFQYSVELPEPNWFYQRDVNGVFWLRVAAVFSQAPAYPWGWTNHQHVFNDYAVTGKYRIASPGWTKTNDDMSFMLMTDPNYCIDSADYTYDCIVDFVDFDFLADDWLWNGPEGGCRSGDLDCDGDVELSDLMILADQWLVLTVDQTACPDIDGDGYGRPGSHCCPYCQRDCDDANANVHPGATEICNNGRDDDCDGATDCADSQCACADADGDGFGATASLCCPFAGIDCNDSNPNVNPGATEVCTNGVDDDCDGLIDCNDPNCDADYDNDGYCDVPGPCCQFAEADCNDHDAAVHPGAAEVCDDGKDNDCDGLTDCDDSDCLCADGDSDGYGNPPGVCCSYPGTDCNDSDSQVNPGATEICDNGKDDDCDGATDCADSQCACADLDGDGYGNPPGPCCAYPDLDCDDTDANIFPGAPVLCDNGKDDDCDTLVDCQDSDCTCSDADGDGYGDPPGPCCAYSQQDCNDNDPNVHPGTSEICANSKDDDCDTQIDCNDSDCSSDPSCSSNWPQCWNWPYQCHGDADNQTETMAHYIVYDNDLAILSSAYNRAYPDPVYNPCADFDRDGDVDSGDMAILTSNWKATTLPTCAPGGIWPP
jgi:hypothetical protein